MFQMKDMIKLYKSKRSSDLAHEMVTNGLEIKQVRNRYASSRNRIKTDYGTSQPEQAVKGYGIFEKKKLEKSLTKEESLKKSEEDTTSKVM